MGLRKLWELVGHGTIAEGSRRALAARPRTASRSSRRRSSRSTRRRGRPRRAAAGSRRPPGDRARRGLAPRSRARARRARPRRLGFAGVPAAAEALARFDGGRLLILIAGAPYPCPPAPYECAFHLDEHLRARGLRDRTELAVVTLQPMLMPNAGWAGSEWMAGQLAERDISQRIGAKAERVEAGHVVLADGERGAVRPADRGAAAPAARRRRRQRPRGRPRLDRGRPGHARHGPRGRLRGRGREPDPALERAAAAEGRRDGRAAGAPRRPCDRGRAARRGAAAAVRRHRLLPGRDRQRARRPSSRATGTRSRSPSSRSPGRAARMRREGRLRDRAPAALVRQLSGEPGAAAQPAAVTRWTCHSPGTPLSTCVPRSANSIPEPTTRSLTVLETSTSLACGERRDPGAEVDGEALDARVGELDLARVEPGADLEAEPANRVADRAGAPDRARRAVERGQEAVAGDPDLLAAEPLQPVADERVVLARGAPSSSGRRARRRARSSRRCP